MWPILKRKDCTLYIHYIQQFQFPQLLSSMESTSVRCEECIFIWWFEWESLYGATT